MASIIKEVQLPKVVFQDKIKWVLIPAKAMLDSLSLWPENQSKFRRFLILLCFANIILVMSGNIYYLIFESTADDLASASFVIILLLPLFETVMRQIFVTYYRKDLKKILKVVYFDFWPSNINGYKLERKLKKISWFVIIYCFMYTASACLCVFQLLMMPLLKNSRILIFHSTYPFAYWKSPLYEILQVWQVFMSYLVVLTICGLDLFFVTLTWNCIGQFILLKNFLEDNFEKYSEMEIIIKGVQHHNLLIRTCNELKNIFGSYILVLFLTSIGTVCVSCFVAIITPQEIGTCGTYLLGHLCQLFMYCYLGSLLIEQSTALSDAIFHCGWHLSKNTNRLKHPLLMMMAQAQQGQNITARGFAVLDLQTFLKILKFSFSLYTVLESFTEK